MASDSSAPEPPAPSLALARRDARPPWYTRPFQPFRSIRVQILVLFSAALLLLLGAQFFLISRQAPVSASLALISEGYIPLSKVAARLSRDYQRVERDLTRLLDDDERRLPPLVRGGPFEESLQSCRDRLQYARELPGISAEEAATLAKVGAHLDAIQSAVEAWQGRVDEWSARIATDRETADLEAPLQGVVRALGEEVDKLDRLIDGRINQLVRSTEEDQAQATTVAFALSGFAVFLSVLLLAAVLLALRPIRWLTTEVQRIGAGDYSRHLDVGGADEVAVLAAEFNAMVKALELRDRTLVERAEQLNRLSRYLGSVLDNLSDALVVVESGRVTLTNPAAVRDFAIYTNEPLPGSLSMVLRGPGRRVLVDQGRRWEIRAVPFGDAGLLALLSDITEHWRAQERLARSERLAMIGQMLAQITHEVRNPLNALSLNAELLTDELAHLDREHRSEGWEILGIMSKEIGRLTAVTGHYLQLARRPPASLVASDLRHVLDEVARLVDVELIHSGVELAVEGPPTLPAVVDANQVRQALLNIVRNASEAGARRIILRLDQQDGEVLVVCEDDGPGMTDEQVERACDPFFSTKVDGTGLGLAITKQILDDHDGQLRVQSVIGEGTKVILVFPDRSRTMG